MNKKIIALILCIFCLTSIFALASCSGSGDTDTDAPTEIVIYLDVKGGTMNFSQEFEWGANEDIEYLPTPTKEGYEFLGWSLNGEIVTVPFSASEDILLVAEWNKASDSTDTDTDTDTDNGGEEKPYYTVTFNPNGGTFTGELTVEVQEGEKIPKPENPVYEGKIFSGWHSGSTAASKWDFDTMVVTGNVTLTAWYQGSTGCAHEETVPVPEMSYAATCENMGKAYVRCTKCGLTSFTNIAALEHDLVTEIIPETCATDGYTHVYCQRTGCDKDTTHSKVPATGDHKYGANFVTIIPPTQYVGGEEAKFCEVCGKSQSFKIPSLAELDELLWDLDIGNYTYTGGDYVNASFVDISKSAGLSASSYYTVCVAKNAIDGGAGTFWCADTLADGANFTGDALTMSFAQAYDIGMIKLTVPHYSAWDLGEDCYVSYDLEAMIDGKWQVVGVLSDKNAIAAGNGGAIIYEFDAPINTDQLRFVVNHSTRNTPAMIYEIEVMAAVDKTERVSADLVNASTVTSSGKYNSWASGAEALMDGSHSTGWYTNRTGDIFATISFSEDKFVTAVQFSVNPTGKLKQFTIQYLSDDGETWINACTYTVSKSSSISMTGDSNGDGEVDGTVIETSDGEQRAVFTCDIAKFTSGVKLVVDKAGDAWESYVYEFVPYTAIEQAADIDSYGGCAHNSFKEIETVTPGCTTAGYKIMQCYGCGFTCTTDAVDSYGHAWSEYAIATLAEGTSAGTKQSTCLKDGCDATRTTNYYNNFEDPKITTYKHNAPAAWAQTLDDGNYLATYEWIIPKLQEYGWKATAVLSVCYVDMYVDEWRGYIASGVLDIGSHSYTHGGYYSGQISENSLLSDVVNAHYWFMNKFAGQRILGFATPNGQTSTGTSEYVTGIMAAARNGGNSKYFYNVIEELAGNGYGQSPLVGSITVDEETGEVIFTQSTDVDGNLRWVSTRRAWGNLNSYISKSDQTEGPYVFADSKGGITAQYKKITQIAVIDDATGEQAVDEDGNLVWETLDTPIYEATSGGYDLTNGSYTFNEKGGAYALICAPNGTYHYVERKGTNVNYVYDEEANRLVDIGRTEGTYRYYETYKDGKLWDAYYEWVEVGSYDYSNGEFVFREDNNGAYKLNHTALGSYEKGINEILAAGGMTVECLHEIGQYGSIWSSYASTNSKFKYLDQTGIWVCSYTELIQYMKEQLSATLTLVERTDSSITLTLTDTLDDYMYNLPLTIEVDIDDSWAQYGIKATQNGADIPFFIENGYVYVDAVPDAGDIVITPATLCTDGTANHQFTEWTETKAATCTVDGEKTSDCDSCGFVYKEVIKASHSYSEDVVDGFKLTSTCSVCKDVLEEEIADVTDDVFSPLNATVNGDITEGSHVNYLFDGNLENTADSALVAAGSSLSFEISFPATAEIDFFYVKGAGTDTYSVSVIYEGETEATEVGTGSLFGMSYVALDPTKQVSKVIFTQTSFEGESVWQEIVFGDCASR